MLIEIYSDAVCPWCFIGKRRLERAKAMRPDVKLEVRWRAFQLNPWMPAEGMGRAEYLTAKFGAADAGRVYQNIGRIGAGEGIDFSFDRQTRTPNTVDAHRLVRWAGREAGTDGQERAMEALFQAYFIGAKDIGEQAALVETAAAAGLDPDRAEAYLAGDEDRDDVRAEDAAARQMGIQGVPCFIVDRRYAVSGAQEPEYFMPLFDLAANPTPSADFKAPAPMPQGQGD